MPVLHLVVTLPEDVSPQQLRELLETRGMKATCAMRTAARVRSFRP